MRRRDRTVGEGGLERRVEVRRVEPIFFRCRAEVFGHAEVGPDPDPAEARVLRDVEPRKVLVGHRLRPQRVDLASLRTRLRRMCRELLECPRRCWC